MKKFFSFFAAVLFAGSMMAEGLLFEQVYPGSPSAYTNNYTSSFTITTGDYALTYANFNNGKETDQWTAIRCGRKSEASLATITSAAIADNVSKVLVNVTQANANKTNKLALLVADNASFTNATEITQTIAVGEIVFEIAAPSANKYYQICFDMQADGSYNGFNRIDKVQFISPDGGTPIVPVVYDTLNVAQAINTASALADNATSGKFYIEGYAVNVAAYSTTYNNQDFYLVDNAAAPDSVLLVFRATPMKDGKAYPVLAGDQLRIFGALKKYVKDNKTQLEIVESTIEFVKEAEGDREIDIPEVDTITVARALAIGDSIGQGNTTAGQYVIEGYVTALTNNSGVANVDGGWAQYGNQCMWVADTYDEAATTKETAFFIYQGVAPEQVTKHAKIRVQCAIKNYNGMIETAVSKGAITILEKGDDPVAPSAPDTVNVAQAVAVGMALADNAKTDKEYVVYGYVGTAYAPKEGYSDQTWFMADEEGAFGEFEAYRCTPDSLVKEGDFVYVKGQIQKYVTDSKTQIEISNGTAYHGVAPAPVELEPITVAEALEIAKALTPEKQKSAKTSEKYAVQGYVTKIKNASDKTYFMADEMGVYAEFQAFKCASIDYDVTEGDLVIVTGYIEHYYGEGSSGEYHNYEISKGALVHVYGQGIENVNLTEKVQKVMMNGAMYIIRNGKMYNVQGAQVR